MPSRNHAIDILRAVSILYIVGYWHLLNYTPALYSYINPYTEGIKDVILGTFVFTSGYLLAIRPLGLQFTELLSFYRRRLVRIYPLYAFALLLFLWAGLVDKLVIFRGALLLSMFVPPTPQTLWFITMIMSFYLLAPILIHFTTRPIPFLAICTAILLGCAGFSTLINHIDLRMPLYFPAFALGIMMARHAKTRQLVHSNRMAMALLTIPAFFLFHTGNEFTFLGIAAIVPLVLTGTIALFAYIEHYGGSCQNATVLFISYSSFCMYLFHRVVYHYVTAIYFPTDSTLQVIYLLVFGMGCTILFSYLIQKGYDRILMTVEHAATKT